MSENVEKTLPLPVENHGDNLGVVPLISKEENSAVLEDVRNTHILLPPVAQQAADAGHEQARSTLTLSDQTGLGPEHIAADPQAVQKVARQQELEDILPLTPALKAFAAQSPQHAAAVGDDVAPLSVLEWVFGRGETINYMPYALGPIPPAGDSIPSAFLGFIRKGSLGAMANVQRFWLGMLQSPHWEEATGVPGGPGEEEIDAQKKKIQATETEADKPVPGADPDSYAGKVVMAAPVVAAMGISSLVPGGPAAFLYTQSYGDVHRQLENDDRFTLEEKRDLAGGVAAVATIIGAGAGERFITSLIPSRLFFSGVQKALTSELTGTLSLPVWRSILTDAGRNVLSGTLLQVGMETTEAFGLEMARAKKDGRDINESMLYQTIKRSFQASLALIPYGAGSAMFAHAGELGRWANSVHDHIKLASGVEASENSKLVQSNPVQAKELIKSMPGEPSIYIDASAYEGSGGDPPQESKRTGAPTAVPREEFVTSPAAKNLLKNSKLDPDGLTPKELAPEADRLAAQADLLRWQRQPSYLAPLLAERATTLQEPPTPERRAKLNDIEQRMRTAVHQTEPKPGGGAREPASEINVPPKQYADAEVAQRKLGEMGGLRRLNEQIEQSSNTKLVNLQEKALKASEKSIGTAQQGVEAGVEAGQHGRNAAVENMNFARTARFREWLKGLSNAGQTPEPSGAVAPKDELGVEKWKTENGLYDLPGIGVQVPEKSLAEKWRNIGEDQRKQAIAEYKASQKSEVTAGDKYVKSVNKEIEAGDAAAEAQMHRRSRDLAYAMKNALRRSMEEGQKVQSFLDVRATDLYRTLFAKAGREYRQGYDAIMESIGLRPQGPGQDVDFEQTLQKMRDGGAEVTFDEEHIKDLIRHPHGIDDMTLAEAQNVKEAVRQLRAAARDSLEVELDGQRKALRQRVLEVYNTLRNVPEGYEIGKYRSELNRPEVILKRLGMEDVFREFVAARNKFEELSKETGEHLSSHLDKVPKEILNRMHEPVEGPRMLGRVKGLPSPWTRSDLHSLGAWMGSESGAQGAADGLGVPVQEIYRVLDQLTPEEWKHMVQGVHWDLGAKLWDKIRAHVEEQSGIAPEERVKARPITLPDGTELPGGYTPRRWLKDSLRPATQGSVGDAWGKLRDGITFMGKPFLKSRSDGFSATPDFTMASYAAHLNRVNRVLAYDNFVRNFGKILADPEFREIVTDHVGKYQLEQLDSWHRTVARGFVESATDGAQHWNAVAGSLARSRAATAAFQLNLPVNLMQFSHIPATMFGLGIGPQHMVRGMIDAFRPDTWKTAFAESQQLPYRWNDYGRKTRELLGGMDPPGDFKLWLQQHFPRTMALNEKFGEYTDAVGWASFKLTDAFIAKTIYGARKSQALRAGASPEEAIRLADEAVSLGLPARNIAEQSAFTRDKGFIGSLSVVHNFPNTLENLAELQHWQARTTMWNDKSTGWNRVLKVGGASAVAGASILAMMWSAEIFGHWLGGKGREKDESYGDYLERQAIVSLLYPFPIVGPMSEQHKMLTQFGKGNISAGFKSIDDLAPPPMQLLGSIARGAGHALDRNLPTEDRLFAGSEVLMRMKGIPVQPLPHGKFVFDALTGRLKLADGVEAASGAVYPRSVDKYGGRRRQTPFTDTKDFFKAVDAALKE